MKKIDRIILISIIIVGILLRLLFINSAPAGFNQDEASIGYEAYAIANYGIDRNGRTLPVHLISWGSGQNALYAYLCIPFIKVLGNSVLATRLPMALIGCLSMLAVAFFVQRYTKLKQPYKLFTIFLFAIFPWHILKSRWGLESNLFPDLILYSSILLYIHIKKHKVLPLVASAVILGLSTYAYGTSYVFVPVFIIAIAALLLKAHKLKVKNLLLFTAIAGAVSAPIICFIIINYFDLPEFKLFGIFTIPRLDYNRFSEIANVNGNFFSNAAQNLKNAFLITVNQADKQPLNFVPHYGIFYLFSLPFIVYGIVVALIKKRKNVTLKIASAFLIASIIVAAMVQPNINRDNGLWLPLFVFLCVGLIDIIKRRKIFAYTMTALYFVYACAFQINYYTDYQKAIRPAMRVGLKQAILRAESERKEGVTVNVNASSAYIFYLYYAKIDPNYYYETVSIPKKKVMFQSVQHFGDDDHLISFDTIREFKKNQIYVLSTTEAQKIQHQHCTSEKIGDYSVINCIK